MKILPLICQVLLGLMFVVFGANGLHQFIPAQMPPAGTMVGDWAHIMHASHWMGVIALLQVVGGALVLYRGTVPLGLTILGPIIFNILCFHMLLTGGQQIAPGAVAAMLELILIYYYRAHFAGILTTNAVPDVKPKTFPTPRTAEV